MALLPHASTAPQRLLNRRSHFIHPLLLASSVITSPPNPNPQVASFPLELKPKSLSHPEGPMCLSHPPLPSPLHHAPLQASLLILDLTVHSPASRAAAPTGIGHGSERTAHSSRRGNRLQDWVHLIVLAERSSICQQQARDPEP